jgi:hypothetical protein
VPPGGPQPSRRGPRASVWPCASCASLCLACASLRLCISTRLHTPTRAALHRLCLAIPVQRCDWPVHRCLIAVLRSPLRTTLPRLILASSPRPRGPAAHRVEIKQRGVLVRLDVDLASAEGRRLRQSWLARRGGGSCNHGWRGGEAAQAAPIWLQPPHPQPNHQAAHMTTTRATGSRVGLVALSPRTAAHPLQPRFAHIFGTDYATRMRMPARGVWARRVGAQRVAATECTVSAA